MPTNSMLIGPGNEGRLIVLVLCSRDRIKKIKAKLRGLTPLFSSLSFVFLAQFTVRLTSGHQPRPLAGVGWTQWLGAANIVVIDPWIFVSQGTALAIHRSYVKIDVSSEVDDRKFDFDIVH